MGRTSGFTLVELLVSLFIFGMLSAAGVVLLSFSVRAQEAADARLGDLADFRRAGALLAGDLAQAAPRLARDGAGRARPALEGNSGEQGGMALLNAHPDYLLEPKFVELYRRYLEHFAADERCWRALPRDVAAWWRRRAETTVVRDGDTWRLEGPAAGEARLAFFSGA